MHKAKQKKMQTLFSSISNELYGCKEKSNLTKKKGAFTRVRKLSATRMVCSILRGVKGAIQLEMDALFEEVNETSVSKQAFSKRRQDIDPAYIRSYADQVSEYHADDEDRLLYKGMTVVAIDGSDIALPNSKALLEYYGGSGPKKNAPTALASMAYDPLNSCVYDFRLDKYATDERTLAEAHMNRLKELGLHDALLLFDRWYPSKKFIAYALSQGFSFIMRVRNKWNQDVDDVKTQAWVDISCRDQAYRIRVLKVKLPTGEVETLLTNLNQRMLPIHKASELYWKRWGVETALDLLKSKLQLENFSGKTRVAIEQDFYASIFLASMANVLMSASDDMIAARDAGKTLKYKRKSNQNCTVAKQREFFLQSFYATILTKEAA